MYRPAQLIVLLRLDDYFASLHLHTKSSVYARVSTPLFLQINIL